MQEKEEIYSRKIKLSNMQCNDGYVPRTSWRGRGFRVQSQTLHSFGLVVITGWSLGRDDTFFRHTFLGVGSVSPFVFCNSKNSYAGFFIWHSSDCEAWFASLPLEFVTPPESADFPRTQWGLQCSEAMVSLPLSRVSFSNGPPWLVSIVRPSVWRRTSPSNHWCWAEFLQLRHQYGCLLYSRMACPG